ncbi:MAG TPA: FAD-binding protein [Kofleriaceae bacterium]|jgi:FAD/FMN-containing dehydrogenase|nr:FAD-binding protein [Kofleriaceae bacterium]
MATSRRGFMQGVVGGALVLGLDLRTRSWVTHAVADAGIAGLPRLDGELRTAGLAPFAADFGRIVSHPPRAVLVPGSVEDIVKIVGFARRHGLRVAANGQAGTDDLRESHSNLGQSQVEAGIAIDMSPLDAMHAVDDHHADVGAGAHWSAVFDAAAAHGATPPVFTDYVHLSVGGTLSVGGIGGTSQHFGVQVDNVDELDVVTGRGERVVCSRASHRELFEAVLAGAGQCAIIVRAKLRLVRAAPQARVFLLFYDDLDAYLADQLALLRDRRFSYLEGQVVRRADDSGWRFMIEAASYFTPPRVPDDAALLAGLRDHRPEAQITTQSDRDFIFRLDPTVALLKSIGVWQLPHPWITLFLPAAATGAYVSNVLSTLTPADTGQGPILLYPFDPAKLTRPLFRAPAAPAAFQFSILRTAAPATSAVIAAMLAGNRRLYDDAVAVGGVRYAIGAIPDFTPHDWRRHFGGAWDFLARSKQRFDPDRILTPGQGMFAA